VPNYYGQWPQPRDENMTTIHCLGSGLVGSFVIKELLSEGMKINVVDIEKKTHHIEHDLVTIHVKDAYTYCQEITNDNDY
jgi:glutamate dehydrogenase/leucine dehydrogenase